MLEVRNVSKSFRGLRAVRDASFTIPEGDINGLIGPKRRRQDHHLQHHRGRVRAGFGRIYFNGNPIQGLRPDESAPPASGRTFQIVKPFAGLSVLDNVIVGALHRASGVGQKPAASPAPFSRS
jgi:branched-chain amino acid transport system ATP-binding protein